jgi:hypothetical protein
MALLDPRVAGQGVGQGDPEEPAARKEDRLAEVARFFAEDPREGR